jgi:hypothetical protein
MLLKCTEYFILGENSYLSTYELLFLEKGPGAPLKAATRRLNVLSPRNKVDANLIQKETPDT